MASWGIVSFFVVLQPEFDALCPFMHVCIVHPRTNETRTFSRLDPPDARCFLSLQSVIVAMFHIRKTATAGGGYCSYMYSANIIVHR
jgi:hypothetical protein